MVDYAGIGGLFVGIAALIGVIWNVYKGERNKKDLEGLEKIVKPMTRVLKQFRDEVTALRDFTSKLVSQQKPTPHASGSQDMGLELRRKELEVRRQELEWKKLAGAAKALGWFLDRVEEDEEWEDE